MALQLWLRAIMLKSIAIPSICQQFLLESEFDLEQNAAIMWGIRERDSVSLTILTKRIAEACRARQSRVSQWEQ
jgi:hypothetical protein